MRISNPNGARTFAHPRAAAVFGALMLVVGLARLLAVFTENVNWDEFALLQRAVAMSRTGELLGGGRPGLGTLVLVPFALECRNAVDALVQARLLWTLMVVASAVAFWYLLRGVLRPSPHRWIALATGLGLWVLAPPFLRFSAHVRTDQPAILFGLLAGIALLESRRRLPWALAAGVLLGIGFLFSQKLLYVAGLVGVMAAGQLLLRGEWRPRREVLRAALMGLGSALVVAGYRQVMTTPSGGPAILPVSGALSTFEYYREFVSWQLYRAMLPLLVPQLLAIGALLIVTVDWLRDRGPHGRELLAGWAVLLVGIAVLLFHAARFPYFYLVLGLFPAVVGALVVGSVLDRVERPAARAAFLAALWIPLATFATLQGAALTRDARNHQRESLAFVERTFPRDARGFEGHGAFACRHDPDPFPVRFNQHVVAEFRTNGGAERGRKMVEEFRARPVAFLIPPIELAYPEELWQFWRTRYVHYHGAVHVPGREVRGPPGWSASFEAVVPGEYVWRPGSAAAAPLEVDDREIAPGEVVLLDGPGPYRLGLPAGGAGMLVLVLPEPPAPDSTLFFQRF